MSTTVDIELVPSEDDRLLEQVQEATIVDIELVPSEEDRLLEHVQEATTVDIGLVASEEDRLLESVTELPLQSKHPIFLSHSGAQKNFVEQLCLDLEHQLHHTPFFDKYLPKGEVFPQHIFQAAQQCELAIVVVSEEYFSRSKWPMLELSMFVHSSKCKIFPLFFGLTCKEFKDDERRERWFQTWDAWAQKDPRVRVEDWKLALHEVGDSIGLEFVAAVGEVGFRKKVVKIVAAIVPDEWVKVEMEEDPFEETIFNPIRRLLSGLRLRKLLFIILKVIGGIIGLVVLDILFSFLVFRVIFPITHKYVLPKTFEDSFSSGRAMSSLNWEQLRRNSHLLPNVPVSSLDWEQPRRSSQLLPNVAM